MGSRPKGKIVLKCIISLTLLLYILLPMATVLSQICFEVSWTAKKVGLTARK